MSHEGVSAYEYVLIERLCHAGDHQFITLCNESPSIHLEPALYRTDLIHSTSHATTSQHMPHIDRHITSKGTYLPSNKTSPACC